MNVLASIVARHLGCSLVSRHRGFTTARWKLCAA